MDPRTLGTQVERALSHAVASTFANDPVAGAVAGVVSGRDLVWSTTWGFADLSSGAPVTTETLFRAASITKTFTATAVVQLRDAGLLRLDDPLVAHVPEFASVRNPFGPVEDVTLLRLLTHTAGLPVEAPGFDWLQDRYPDAAAIVEAFDGLSLVVAPDERVKYSNLGYQLLGEVIARVAGVPYPEVVDRGIVGPLGMRGTSFAPGPELDARRASGYDARVFTDDLPRAEERPKATLADGGLWTTLADLARWATFQLVGEGRVLHAPSLAAMHRPHRVTDAEWRRAVGLGWYLHRTASGVRLGHSGGTFGFVARIAIDPARGLGVVILANGDAPLAPLADAMLDIVAGVAVAHEPATTSPPPPMNRDLPSRVPHGIAPLLGLYAWEDLSFVVRVEWRAARLTVGGGEGSSAREPATLRSTDDPDVFVVEEGRSVGERLTFLRSDEGVVDGLTLGGWPLVRLIPARAPKPRAAISGSEPRAAPPRRPA